MFARVLMFCSIPVALVLSWYLWDNARIEVDLAAVQIGEAVDAVPAEVTLERVVEINVNSEIAGRVVASTLRTGQAVTEGDVLFEISPVGKPETRVAVKAAFDGVITKILVRPGEAVPAFAPLARLWNGRAEVVAHVAPEHFDNIEVGLESEISLPNLGGVWVPARVLKVPGYAEDAGGGFRLVMGIDLPAEQLFPGLKGEAVILRRRIPDALLIPEAAVEDGFVFIVDGKHVRRVAVETGLAYHGQVQVVKGLSVNNAIVLRSAVPLADGDRIRVRGY